MKGAEQFFSAKRVYFHLELLNNLKCKQETQ